MQDDITHGVPLLPCVREVTALNDYRLSLIFTNGERRIFDVKPLISLGVYKPLQNKKFFESVRVADDSILWANSIYGLFSIRLPILPNRCHEVVCNLLNPC